jgi:hypothetical protein
MRGRLPAQKIQTQERNMSFDVHHLRTLRDACIWDLPQQMAYLAIPGDPIITFPQYFLRVETGEVIRKIEDLPNECAVLTRLQRVVQEQLPLRDPEDHLELVYTSRETDAFITNSPRQVAHALCAPCYVGHYHEIAGTGRITLQKDWFFRPDQVKAFVLVYPQPYQIEVRARWVPDVRPYTLEWDIELQLDDNYLIVVVVNGELMHIAWLTLPHDE